MRLSLEYIAAFLDCDGTIVITRSNRGISGGIRHYGKICMYSQNLAVLEDIRETIGGVITPLHHTSLVYTLQFSPKQTLSALHQLQPFLRIKREQALLVIALHKQIAATKKIGKRYGLGGGMKLDASVYEQREAMYLQMKEHNRKDAKALRTNRVNSVKAPGGVTPSQAEAGEDSAEGVTTRGVSPNNNLPHEDATRKGRHSLSNTVAGTIQ